MKGKKFDKQYDFKDETLKYSLMEEKRPGEYYPVYEDIGGTFLFNSKDLCMINNIEDIIKSGVKVLRIEARKKSDEYLETVIKSYRDAIDKFYENKKEYKINPKWSEEIKNATHREFTTGFYLDRH
jgi:putative protease